MEEHSTIQHFIKSGYGKNLFVDCVFNNSTFFLYEKKGTLIDFTKTIDNSNDKFVGRIKDIKDISNYININKNGYLFITGEAGIGKTAFTAKLITEITKKTDIFANFYTIAYFLKDIDDANLENFYATINSHLDKIYINPDEKNEDKDNRSQFFTKIQNVSDYLVKIEQRLIIFIDGLDEILDNETIKKLTAQTYKNVLFIYSTRINEFTENFINSVSPREKYPLTDLEQNDTTNILKDQLEKFDNLTNEYVNQIRESFKGNPLHYTLFCKLVNEGNIEINNVEEITAIDEPLRLLYDKLWIKLSGETKDYAYFFAVLQSEVSTKFISHLVGLKLEKGINADSAKSILSLNAVLNQNNNKYELSHRTFKEFLIMRIKS